MKMYKSFETTLGEKQSCRELICELADQEIGHDNVKKIFTLPSREALCYKNFKRHYRRSKIVCIERDEEICNYLWDKKNIDCINTTIREYSKERVSREQHHDVVFLDYYSYLHNEILIDIESFLSNDNIIHPGKKTILAITLQKGMRGHKDQTIDIMREYLYRGWKREITNNLRDVSNSISTYISCEMPDLQEVKLLEAKEYKAEAGSTSMYFIVLSVLK